MDTKVKISEGKIFTNHLSNSMTFENARDFENFVRNVRIETSYKGDIINDLNERRDMKKYDAKSIMENKRMFNYLVENYATLRMENDGGDVDKFMNFRECLDEVFENFLEDFQDELTEYLIR